jgi:deoxyribonuclease-4
MTNKKATFAPGGNAVSFGKRKFPEDLPGYLAGFDLNGYELECGRGLRVSQKTLDLLPKLAAENGIFVTLHAPYYISLSSVEEETRDKSAGWILQSAQLAKALNITKIVVHSGSCANISRQTAMALASETLKKAQRMMDESGCGDVTLCPETMGKINQLGTWEEVTELCKLDERFLPCVDFGHQYARTFGGFQGREAYTVMFDRMEDELGFARVRDMHMHFSKVEFTPAGGEKKHLCFADPGFELDYRPLLELIAERGYAPSIVCESAGTQAEDAAEMKRYYNSLL